MKKRELRDLKNKSVKELIKIVDKKAIEIMKVKAKSKVSKEKNLKHVKNIKKDVAQIKTVIREKEFIDESSKVKEKTKEGNHKAL